MTNTKFVYYKYALHILFCCLSYTFNFYIYYNTKQWCCWENSSLFNCCYLILYAFLKINCEKNMLGFILWKRFFYRFRPKDFRPFFFDFFLFEIKTDLKLNSYLKKYFFFLKKFFNVLEIYFDILYFSNI